MNRSRLKKKYQDRPLKKTLKTGKNKKLCNKLCRKAEKDHFKNIAESKFEQ